MIHGGDLQTYYEEYQRIPLDFSANISPLGLPKEVEETLIQNIKSIETYPDPQCRKLRKELSNNYGLPPDYFLCGNGAADLIYRLNIVLKPKNVLLLAPTFAEYEESLQGQNCDIHYYFLKESLNFTLKEDFLDLITTETSLCILCQPNNPTGQLSPPELMEKIIEKTKNTNTLLLVDLCFLDFLEEELSYDLREKLEGNPHIFLLKAFTKIYALPGLRLGYGISSNKKLLEAIEKAGQPWGVSSLAQEAGITALKQTNYVTEVKKLIKNQRNFLYQALEKFPLKLYPSHVNYILFYCEDHNLHLKLKKHNILIRDCANYIGLKKGYFRIAVRSEEENKLLIKALESEFLWQK